MAKNKTRNFRKRNVRKPFIFSQPLWLWKWESATDTTVLGLEQKGIDSGDNTLVFKVLTSLIVADLSFKGFIIFCY
jgi:hypothetical protein